MVWPATVGLRTPAVDSLPSITEPFGPSTCMDRAGASSPAFLPIPPLPLGFATRYMPGARHDGRRNGRMPERLHATQSRTLKHQLLGHYHWCRATVYEKASNAIYHAESWRIVFVAAFQAGQKPKAGSLFPPLVVSRFRTARNRSPDTRVITNARRQRFSPNEWDGSVHADTRRGVRSSP
jgi:hypothetical protein